ncbi:MAG TPA: hypothetical protein VFW13_11985 [Phenylobacterium sp.]|nr:hypothetical protein [Phenylobacterium sp.]
MKLTLSLPAVAVMLAAAPGLAHAGWTKTYAVEWNEPAMYYGAKTGVIDPGTDCPKGTNAEPNWIQVMVDAGYTRAEAEWLRNPANPTRSPVHGQNQMAFRGKDRANVYINPTSTADADLVGVSGTVGEGLDLDGDPKTGFTSPTGEKGIDNNFYKALGCWKTYRGPARQSSGALQFNDSMRQGSWTMVVVVSGQGQDPLNDKAVTVGFYMSPDKLVKDGAGGIARDYTFRVKPDAKYEALFKAKTVKGEIRSTQASDEVWLRNPGYDRDLQLLKARVSLTMQPDGTLKGYVGGYRPWEPVYEGWVGARGPVIEALTWVRLPDVYYALKRNADYSPTGPKGEKTHISYALRIEAVPAFVTTPDAKDQVVAAVSYKALAPKAPAAAPAPVRFGNLQIVDGIVVPAGAPAVSQSAELLTPPHSPTTGGGR